ncbi:hypothetical protein PV10_02804 [Exophiala mesophila]|uniref:MARVEL domain-containing protein n=1 Tax=Exophiala mesophila TaxID=212818 RepID=A0A0D1X042_EXOME|nr:uncharacterized protein PV10_02804 [Exophiala mesophila]KIV95115.1 hypothetical protein PV10_02804 [Exophiala mesophila]
MARVKNRPQAYSPMSFHLVRGIAFVCQAIVSGILIWFCLRLRDDGFKLPWTFLIVLAASLLSIITLIITSIFYCCSFLSPLFNLIINSTVLLVQIVGFGLLTYNIFGTLGHSCSRSNWASSKGVTICQIYKAFYSFLVFAMLAQIALIVLDVRSRREQTRLGKYGNIEESNSRDVKMDRLNGLGPAHAHQPSHASSVDTVPYGIQYGDQPTRPAAYQPPSYAPQDSRVRMDDFGGYNNGYNDYGHQQQSGYGGAGYGYR